MTLSTNSSIRITSVCTKNMQIKMEYNIVYSFFVVKLCFHNSIEKKLRNKYNKLDFLLRKKIVCLKYKYNFHFLLFSSKCN